MVDLPRRGGRVDEGIERHGALALGMDQKRVDVDSSNGVAMHRSEVGQRDEAVTAGSDIDRDDATHPVHPCDCGGAGQVGLSAGPILRPSSVPVATTALAQCSTLE